MKQNHKTEISRTRFRLLSLLCITGRFMLMFHYITIATSDSLQSGENCVSSIQGAVLTKHNYASFVMQNMFACYYQCIGDRRCQSLNFYETTKICELNNRTRIVGHLHFQPREGAFYMENPFRVIVECAGNRCQNGGTCDYQGEGQYICRCPQGYSGDHCEKEACSSQPCLNGGICNATANGFTCSCSPLLTGVRCEIGIGVGCDNYTMNNDLDRSVHVLKSNSKCDDALLEGWYRFNSTAGTRIPDYCVNTTMCNTHAPGWLNGNHPTPQEGAVNRTVCFNYGSNCCTWTSAIMMRNCGLFFTYKLSPTKTCYLRYCVTN